jgi:hypothetical protein
MATKLKNLKVTSTDLVDQGANPDAHIRMFKRNDAPGASPDTLFQKCIAALMNAFGRNEDAPPVTPVAKEAETFGEEMEEMRLREVSCEAWDFCYALSDSLSSIIREGDLDESGKRDLMLTSLEQFATTLRNSIPNWAAGQCSGNGEAVAKSAESQAAFDALWLRTAKSTPPEADGGAAPTIKAKKEKEETDTMNIDKSKMTPEERAALDALEKKYGVEDTPPASAEPSPATPAVSDPGIAKAAAEPTATTPELHPDVKKILDENKELSARMEELQKSMEIKDLASIAKKYEVIGKKSDELAPKLYDLKKAGGTAYDDYVALLDEQASLVEKSGLFKEVGSNMSGSPSTAGEIQIKGAEIAKGASGMSSAEAIIKAFEENPELAAQYEKEYSGR